MKRDFQWLRDLLIVILMTIASVGARRIDSNTKDIADNASTIARVEAVERAHNEEVLRSLQRIESKLDGKLK